MPENRKNTVWVHWAKTISILYRVKQCTKKIAIQWHSCLMALKKQQQFPVKKKEHKNKCTMFDCYCCTPKL